MMKGLKELDFSDNRITHLPLSLSELPYLEILRVHLNPIKGVPRELIDGDDDGKKVFLFFFILFYFIFILFFLFFYFFFLSFLSFFFIFFLFSFFFFLFFFFLFSFFFFSF